MNYAKIPLYDAESEKNNLILQKDENIAFIVNTSEEITGIELYMPNPESISEEFILFVYEFDGDYTNTINNSRRMVKQNFSSKIQGAWQTIVFDKLKPGEYIFIIQSSGETLTLSQTAAPSSEALGKVSFLRGGNEGNITSVVCSVIFNEEKSDSKVYFSDIG